MKTARYYADKAEDQMKPTGRDEWAAVYAELAMAAAWIEAAKSNGFSSTAQVIRGGR